MSGGITRRSGPAVFWRPDLILYAIQEFVRVQGRAPKATDWRRAGANHPSTTTVLSAFGSWSSAIVAAGLVPSRGESAADAIARSAGTDPEACWPFAGSRNANGYGLVYIDERRAPTNGQSRGRRAMTAHRFVMQELLGRRLRLAEEVMHSCDNPPCINPAHLRVGTHADNMADMSRKGRASRNGLRGEHNHNAILTDDRVRAIRARKGTAVSRVVGAEFGVSAALIRDIWLGKAWRHVA